MTQECGFDDAVAAALHAWRGGGRLPDLLPPLLEWLLAATAAERAAFVLVPTRGRYRMRGGLNVDGETVGDPEKWVSYFAVQRAVEQQRLAFHADTRQDRRFRTEAELEQGVRTRSILTIPVTAGSDVGVLYLDARFKPMQWRDELEPQVTVMCDLIAMALRLEASQGERRKLEHQVRKLERRQVASPPAERPRGMRAWHPVSEPVNFHGFLTACPALLADIEEQRRIAGSGLSVLIVGESGTGKEVLARALHKESRRKGPFRPLHCGSIPSTLVEVELFGHARGAFTGAEREKSGLIEEASGGTIFLDDVGEMPEELQTALLRVMESGAYRRVSDTEERQADIRAISATQAVDDQPMGNLRTDLYYRLAGTTVRIPPLRERREDILPLARLFVAKYGDARKLPDLDEGLKSAFLAHDWPGNVRELENLIRRFLAFGTGGFNISRFLEITGAPRPAPCESDAGIHSILDRAERDAILRALDRTGGNKSAASKLLGLSRKTFYRRLEKHRIPL